jgi:hypothetical protein
MTFGATVSFIHFPQDKTEHLLPNIGSHLLSPTLPTNAIRGHSNFPQKGIIYIHL